MNRKTLLLLYLSRYLPIWNSPVSHVSDLLDDIGKNYSVMVVWVTDWQLILDWLPYPWQIKEGLLIKLSPPQFLFWC